MPHVRRPASLLPLLVVAGLTAVVARQMPAGLTADAILIGLEGETGSFSADEENLGMRLVVADVNDQGGVHGRRLEIRGRPRQGGAAIDEQISNARRLIDEDRVFLLFNFGGPGSVAVASLAMDRRVPHMFPHTALVTLDGARYVFTSYPRYDGETRTMFRYLARERGFERIGIVADENVYGQFFVDRLTELAAAYGYAVAGRLRLGQRDPGDLKDELATLRASRPDAVVMALYPAQAGRVMEAKAALGWRDVTMVTSGPLTDEQYLTVPGGHAEGTLGFCYYPDPNVSDAPGIAEYRRLMQRYFPGHPLNRYSLYGYAFGQLVVEGLERAGPDLSRDRFVDAMETIEGWDSGGIMPPVSFSRTDHHAQTAGFICELRDGRFEGITGWMEP